MNDKALQDFEEMRLPSAIIFCDIDGIWADCSHRLPYLKKKEYDKFYGACMADDAKTLTASIATGAFIRGVVRMYGRCLFLLLTGRPKRTCTLTRMWFKENYPHTFENLIDNNILCRDDEDWRPAYQIKAELAANYLISDKLGESYALGETDIYFIDDDPKVISYLHDHFVSHLPDSEQDKVNGCVHPILMDAGRLPSSYEQNKSPEE